MKTEDVDENVLLFSKTAVNLHKLNSPRNEKANTLLEKLNSIFVQVCIRRVLKFN